MTPLSVTLDLATSPWLDLDAASLPHNTGGLSAELERVGLLPNGTMGGRSTVFLVIRLPDGTRVAAETTLRLFRMASAAVLATPIAEAERE